MSKIQNQGREKKIPLTSKEEVEKKLASMLTQVQQNRVKRLDLTAAMFGQFYELARTLSGHQSGVSSLAVLKNGFLASGFWNNTIKIWDLASNSCLSTLQGHTDCVFSLAALPNGQLASGSRDNTIKIWDLASGSCLSTLQGHTRGVRALAALPNGLLASGSWDTTIKIWDLTLHSCLATLKGHTDVVYALAALPNGLLASGSRDSTIKFWDLVFHSCLSTLREHTGPVVALAVFPNGLLASGSFDHTIKLWNLESHSCLSTLQGHIAQVDALAVLPNGHLASGSWDTTIKLWGSKTISAKQLPPVLNALKNNTSVTDLDLSGNQNILDDTIDPLMSVFTRDSAFGSKPNTTLKTIDLRGTGVSQKGVKKLEKAIQQLRLSIEVLADCPLEWKMIYFLIVFCRANRNSPFADSGLDLCKHGEIGSFLGVPSGFFAQPCKSPLSSHSKHAAPSPG